MQHHSQARLMLCRGPGTESGRIDLYGHAVPMGQAEGEYQFYRLAHFLIACRKTTFRIWAIALIWLSLVQAGISIGPANFEVRLGLGLLYLKLTVSLVDTSVFTTFYIGSLTNSERVKSRKEAPHFEILFRASYGMTRDQLEVYNEYIRHGRWRSKAYDRDDPFKKVG